MGTSSPAMGTASSPYDARYKISDVFPEYDITAHVESTNSEVKRLQMLMLFIIVVELLSSAWAIYAI